MASIDLNLDYKEAQKKIEASKAYKDLKSQYDDRNYKLATTSTNFTTLYR